MFINHSIPICRVEATKRQTKSELKTQKRKSFLMFREKELVHTPHTPAEDRRYLSQDILNQRGS